MDYTKHHAASTYSLILHQLDWQDQLQCDTRSKKVPLGPSTPAPCWAARWGTKATNIANAKHSPHHHNFFTALPVVI
jgi:hypothetical protein